MGELKIRKLTPGECAKLMGFEKKDQVAMQELNLNDSAQYHIFGDSIVVSCLIGLFGMLLPISEKELQQKINDYVERLVTE